MKPLRSGCRVRMLTHDQFAGRIGTAYIMKDSVPPVVGMENYKLVTVFFTPDHQERAAFMRALPTYDAFAAYYTERWRLGEQYLAPIKEIEVVRSGTRRGKKHRMRVKP